MRSWRIFLILWLGFSTLAPARAAAAADAVLSEVSSALAAGQYEDVIAVSGSGLGERGLDDLVRSRLLIVRGLARQALGNNEDALADFTQGLSIAALPPQERARALFARGVSLDSLTRLNDAVGDYSAVLRLAPGATYALNNRANALRRQGRLEDARRDYLAALNRTNPNPQYPYFGLGQIAEAQGDVGAARGYYNKALTAAPGFPLALERLQALGAPVEGPSGLPADTGIIVLKPPAGAPVLTLHSPEHQPAVPAGPPKRPQTAMRRAPPVPATAYGQGTPLRPTIVEGPSARRGAALVQLGAWRSEQEAQDGWTMMREGAGGLLDGLSPVIVRAEVAGRGVFYRLRTSAPGTASQFCTALMRKGLGCIPARD